MMLKPFLISFFFSTATALPLVSLSTLWIGHFSETSPGQSLEEWDAWEFSEIPRQTLYSLVKDRGKTVIRARSDRAASALMKDVNLDPSEYPYLVWSWKTEGLTGSTDAERISSADDFALRLFVIFEEKAGPFGFLKKLAGDFRGKALNYVWALDKWEGPRPSKVTDKIQMVPVRHGDEEFGNWTSEKRNLVEDYRSVFGETPGQIIGLGLMTDTDDSGSLCISYFGDIGFQKEGDHGTAESSD